jgi:hypothetical protein
MKAWYFASGDEVNGPFSENDMADLIRHGAVVADTMVCYAEMGDEDPEWYPASESEMARLLSGSRKTRRVLDLETGADNSAPSRENMADSAAKDNVSLSASGLCANCGTAVRADARFCDKCGAPLGAETQSAASDFTADSGEQPEIIDVDSSTFKGRNIYNGCFATGIILMIMYFVWGSDMYRNGPHWFFYALNLFAPAVSGVQLSVGGIWGPLSSILTIIHAVLVVWVLVLLFKDHEPWQRPVVIVDRIWGFCTFSALVVAIFLLVCFLKMKAEQDQRYNEERRAARILNEAWRMNRR